MFVQRKLYWKIFILIERGGGVGGKRSNEVEKRETSLQISLE